VVSLAGEEHTPVAQANHFNAPVAALRVVGAQDGFNFMAEGDMTSGGTGISTEERAADEQNSGEATQQSAAVQQAMHPAEKL
jgi:hypothetical protein